MTLKNNKQHNWSRFTNSKPRFTNNKPRVTKIRPRIADKRSRLADGPHFVDRRIGRLIWVLAWMMGIFILSAQTGDQSGGMSLGIVEGVLKWLGQWLHLSDNPQINIELLHVLLRKSAHFMAYLILAILVRRLVAVDKFGLYKRQTFAMVAITLTVCTLYAVSDEWHQSFVPGRGPGVVDVLIDTAGAVLGMGIFQFAFLLRSHAFKRVRHL